MEKKMPGGAANFANLPPERLHEIAKSGAQARARMRQAAKWRKGLRKALTERLGEEQVQDRLAEALLREALAIERPGNAIRAYETIQAILGEEKREPEKPERRADLSTMSVEELMKLL